MTYRFPFNYKDYDFNTRKHHLVKKDSEFEVLDIYERKDDHGYLNYTLNLFVHGVGLVDYTIWGVHGKHILSDKLFYEIIDQWLENRMQPTRADLNGESI